MPSVDLIVVNYKTPRLLEEFLSSYEEFKPTAKTQMIVVDNSEPKIVRLDDPRVDLLLVPGKNNGYASALNAAVSKSEAEYIGFFNADTRFTNDECVDMCVKYLFDHNDVAVVGPLQVDLSGKVTAGGIFGSYRQPVDRGWRRYPGAPESQTNTDCISVSGSAFFTKRTVLEELRDCPIYCEVFPESEGAFPPFFHFWEETLYNAHARSHGYKVAYLGEAFMMHHWHKSSPVGSQGRHARDGKKQFFEFCKAHEIEVD